MMIRGIGKFMQKRPGGRIFRKNTTRRHDSTGVSKQRRWRRRDQHNEAKRVWHDVAGESGKEAYMTRRQRKELRKEQEEERSRQNLDQAAKQAEEEAEERAKQANEEAEKRVKQEEKREKQAEKRMKKVTLAGKWAKLEEEDPYLIIPNCILQEMNISNWRRCHIKSIKKNMTHRQSGAAVPTEMRWQREGRDNEVKTAHEGAGPSGERLKTMTRKQRKGLRKQQAEERAKQAEGTREQLEESTELVGEWAKLLEEWARLADEDPYLIIPDGHIRKNMNALNLRSCQNISRREREQKEAEDHYWTLHLQGKTREAKADLARLAKTRVEREVAAAKHKAEAEAKATEIAARRRQRLA